MDTCNVAPSQTLKVCILTTAFPRWKGDHRAPFIFEQARWLRNRGHRVLVIATHEPGAKRSETIDGIRIVRPKYVPARMEILRREEGGLPVQWKKNPLARFLMIPLLLSFCLALIRYARHYDLIHAHWTLAGLAAWLARGIHRRPYLITFHGSDLFYFPRIWPLRLPLLRSILDASALVTVSTFLRRRLTDLGIPAERIETIPDGVDIRKFHPAGTPREPLILFVGSLVEGKGVSHLIRAMPDILLEHPEYKLVIIGDGHLLAELKGLATKLGIGDAVVFKGAQSQANVSRWMQRAKIVVLPALFEGLGVVLLEALACGTPCIATSVGGISDVISPDVGVLVPPRNPQAISEAVSRVLMNPGEYAERSRQARRLAVERFAWNKIIQRIEHLYWQCLSS